MGTHVQLDGVRKMPQNAAKSPLPCKNLRHLPDVPAQRRDVHNHAGTAPAALPDSFLHYLGHPGLSLHNDGHIHNQPRTGPVEPPQVSELSGPNCPAEHRACQHRPTDDRREHSVWRIMTSKTSQHIPLPMSTTSAAGQYSTSICKLT